MLPDAYEGSLSVLFVDGNGQNLAKGMSESIVIPNIGNRYYKLWQTIGKDSKPIPVYNLSFVNPRKDDYYISFHFVTKIVRPPMRHLIFSANTFLATVNFTIS